MDIFVGIVDKESDLRYIVRARAMPTLEDFEDITDGGLTKDWLDWGIEATPFAKRNLGKVLLLQLFSEIGDDLFKYVDAYTSEVVDGLGGNRIWMIARSDIKDWIDKKKPVN